MQKIELTGVVSTWKKATCALGPDRVHMNLDINVNSLFHLSCIKTQGQKQHTTKQTSKTTLHFVEQWATERWEKHNQNILCWWADFSPTPPPLPLFFFSFHRLLWRSIRVPELRTDLRNRLRQRFHFAEDETRAQTGWDLWKVTWGQNCTDSLFMTLPCFAIAVPAVLQRILYLCQCTLREIPKITNELYDFIISFW